jgi:N-methylhydantoinase A
MAILGLHLGVSFAELSLLSDKNESQANQRLVPTAHQRVYLPRLPLKSALQKLSQKFPEEKITKIFVASNHIDKLAPFRLGGSTAHLVTSGWENIGWLSQISESVGSLTRPPAVQAQDLIFGVKERVSADGKVLEALDTNFISSIVAKLKLMDVKRVCIHFLHSQKNPTHTQQAAEILKAEGFEILTDKYDSDLDVEKSRRLSLTAAVASTWDDIKQEFLQAWPEAEQMPQTLLLTSQGFKDIQTATDPLENLSGLDHLWAHFKNGNVVHLGLENFYQVFPGRKKTIWNSPWGAVFKPHDQKNIFETQPTSPLQLNFWNELDFEKGSEGFEPGPMSFGRGQKLTAFDLFFEEMLEQLELRDWIAVAAGGKISSNLSALSKNSKDNRGGPAVGQFLKEQFKKRILFETENKEEALFVGFWSQLLGPFRKTSPRPLSESIARHGLEMPL